MELSGESDCFSASCFGGLKMILIIKEYEGKEEDQLKQLLFSCFEDDMLLNIVNSSRLKFAYAAFIKEKLVGFMFAWMSSIHPYCTYFRILEFCAIRFIIC